MKLVHLWQCELFVWARSWTTCRNSKSKGTRTHKVKRFEFPQNGQWSCFNPNHLAILRKSYWSWSWTIRIAYLYIYIIYIYCIYVYIYNVEKIILACLVRVPCPWSLQFGFMMLTELRFMRLSRYVATSLTWTQIKRGPYPGKFACSAGSTFFANDQYYFASFLG